MPTITRRDTDHVLRILKTHRRRDPESNGGKKGGEYLAEIAEVGAGALAVGVLGGRYGRTLLLGVDTDIWASAALVGASYFNVLGKGMSPHLFNVGNGVLAGYLTKLGASLGGTMRSNAGEPALVPGVEGNAVVGGRPRPELSGHDYDYVTEDQIKNMAQALRAVG